MKLSKICMYNDTIILSKITEASFDIAELPNKIPASIVHVSLYRRPFWAANYVRDEDFLTLCYKEIFRVPGVFGDSIEKIQFHWEKVILPLPA